VNCSTPGENRRLLERPANKWPLAPEHFSFFLLDDGRPQFYRLKRDVIDLNGYTLFSHRNEVVGRLDGKVFTLGGKWRGRVHPNHVNPPSGRAATVLRHADLQRQPPAARAPARP
jgi:hypothetical protein